MGLGEDEWLRHLYGSRLTVAPPNAPSVKATADAEDEAYPVPFLPRPLARNGDILAGRATKLFYAGKYEACYDVSKIALEIDPYHLNVLPVHVAALVQLGRKSVVFYISHQLVNAYPQSAVSWFAAGCYYFLIKKYEHARRFFHKATQIDTNFAPAWIAYGHAFAAHDESDQALAAYRTACRLFPGSHLPWLFIGVEYVRTNSLPLAQQCLELAHGMSTDPCVLNELGVVAFHMGKYARCVDLMLLAIEGCDDETFWNNLGHAYLKLEQHQKALEAFTEAQRLFPRGVMTMVGLAFTSHLLGKLDTAIEFYHRALAVHRDDAFAQEMLNIAIQEAADLR